MKKSIKLYNEYKEHLKERAGEPTLPVRKEFKIFPDFLHHLTELYMGRKIATLSKNQA